jgi:prolyl-tRNA synthetase
VQYRLSEFFLRTLRENPADAEVASHSLLIRAGYLRRAASGGYTWLPMGLMVLQKVTEVIREEMNRAGFQEVHFPALLPKEPYEATNRWTEYGPALFRLKDRRGADYLLAPTHEEMFTLLVKDLYSSYKDLPISLYQIQTKYRDEARPRAGLLRGREFIMKDSYSFDIDDNGLEISYQKHRSAYEKVFQRLEIDYVIVSAQSGAMGGSASEEFLAPADAGEDTYVETEGGAANVEAIKIRPVAESSYAEFQAAEVHETLNTPTIETLVHFCNENIKRETPWTAADTLKNVLVKLTSQDGTTRPLAIGVPGDREVDMRRLEAYVYPETVTPFSDEDFLKYPNLVKGYIGPGELGLQKKSKIEYLVDPRVAIGTAWVTGANEPGKHVFNLVMGRDFTADGQIDVADVRVGDDCIEPSGKVLRLARGIEVGHIFQLGRKYAQALDLKVLNENGEQVTVTMGSYGIGVTRAVAVIAEQHHDEKGLRWPRSISPVDVHLVIAGKDEALFPATQDLADELNAAGISVLIDDRTGVSVGVKFNDAELIGIPTIVVIGKKFADGLVELRDRIAGSIADVAIGELVAKVKRLT